MFCGSRVCTYLFWFVVSEIRIKLPSQSAKWEIYSIELKQSAFKSFNNVSNSAARIFSDLEIKLKCLVIINN